MLAYGGTAAANGFGLAPALSRLRGTYALTRSGGGTRSSRESAGGPANSLLALDSGRYGMRLKDEAGVYRGAAVRSAKPRGAAPECRAELRPTRHRATSHNSACYASVHPARTRGSHVALSGAPPRCLQAEKSGSGCRHTFRPSGNPAGWNRKRSVPLALLSVNPGVIGDASAAATLRGPEGGLSALAGEPPEARFPSAAASCLQVFGIKPRHSPLPPIAVTKNAETFFAPAPALAAGITPAELARCLLVAR